MCAYLIVVKCELSVIFYLSLSRLKNPAGPSRPHQAFLPTCRQRYEKLLGFWIESGQNICFRRLHSSSSPSWCSARRTPGNACLGSRRQPPPTPVRFPPDPFRSRGRSAEAATQSRRDRREQARAAREQARRRAAFEALPQEQPRFAHHAERRLARRPRRTPSPATRRRQESPGTGAFLDDPISGKNKDSLVYDVRNKTV